MKLIGYGISFRRNIQSLMVWITQSLRQGFTMYQRHLESIIWIFPSSYSIDAFSMSLSSIEKMFGEFMSLIKIGRTSEDRNFIKFKTTKDFETSLRTQICLIELSKEHKITLIKKTFLSIWLSLSKFIIMNFINCLTLRINLLKLQI